MKKIYVIIIFLGTLCFSQNVFAESTSGYAWAENIGWIDFSQVTVSTTAISGYAYSPNIGWISMNCSNTSTCGTVDYGITNTSGALSGYAWAENIGWIDFSSVTLSTTSGVFSGYAYSPNIGWISMNCSNTSTCGTVDYRVTTEWVLPVTRSYGNPFIFSYKPPEHLPTTPVPVVSVPTTKPQQIVFKGNISKKSQVLEIKKLQNSLNKIIKQGSFTPLTVDGKFGNKTTLAIKIFQKENNLTPDGIIGPKTIVVINNLLNN